MKKKICMIVQEPLVKGGISSVVNGYRGSKLEKDFKLIYVESYKDGGKLVKLFKAVYSYFEFIKVLFIDKPDLIHIHSSFGASFYRKLPFIYISYLNKKPIINHIHGAEFDSFYTNASKKKKLLIKKVYNKCSTIVALSDEWKYKLEGIVPESSIKVIENYSIIHDDAIIEKNNRKINNQILFLGEIGKRKGCYDIPEVIHKVVKEVPDVKFVLAGSGDVEEIKNLANKWKINSNIVFPGWIRGEEKDKLLRNSDVFFLPSYNEGMPMAILDAMGYGLPIISTNVGGIPKIVINGKNGYYHDAGDTDGFANSIIEILKSEKRIKKYSIASYEIVKDRYSLESHIKHLEELYKKY